MSPEINDVIGAVERQKLLWMKIIRHAMSKDGGRGFKAAWNS